MTLEKSLYLIDVLSNFKEAFKFNFGVTFFLLLVLAFWRVALSDFVRKESESYLIKSKRLNKGIIICSLSLILFSTINNFIPEKDTLNKILIIHTAKEVYATPEIQALKDRAMKLIDDKFECKLKE